MGTVLISIGFWVLLIGLAFYVNHRRRIRWRGGRQPTPPLQAGSSEWPGPTIGGMDNGPRSPFSSPQPQPLAKPGPLLFFKLIAPSRLTKILLGVAALLVLSGLLIMIIAVQAPDAPNLLPRVIAGVAPTVLGGLIWTYLVIALSLRKGKGWRPEGWPPR